MADVCFREDCEALAVARDMCRRHYNQWYGARHDQGTSVQPDCAVDNCPRGAFWKATNGCCALHWHRYQRFGDPLAFRPEQKHSRIPVGVTSPTELAKVLGVTRQRADQLLNPEKNQARDAVARALKAKTLTKPARCARCSQNDRRLEAHHWDYREALDVRWLCRACHSTIHPHIGRSPRMTHKNGTEPTAKRTRAGTS